MNLLIFQVKRRPKIPEQDNDMIPDVEAARISWKNHCLLHESIIVDLFQVELFPLTKHYSKCQSTVSGIISLSHTNKLKCRFLLLKAFVSVYITFYC